MFTFLTPENTRKPGVLLFSGFLLFSGVTKCEHSIPQNLTNLYIIEKYSEHFIWKRSCLMKQAMKKEVDMSE